MNSDRNKHFRSVFSQFATGVTVVSFERENEISGMTVNSFSSVSLDPPLVLFCPSLDCRFAQGANIGGLFTISILAEEQTDICLHFAGQTQLKTPPWREGPQRPPVVRESLAYLRCELEALHLHGDHYVAVGKVLDSEILRDGPPLMFFSGTYPKISLK